MCVPHSYLDRTRCHPSTHAHVLSFGSSLFASTPTSHRQGTFSLRPSNARIALSVSVSWAMAASGSAAWIAWPSKINASSTLSVGPASLLILHARKILYAAGINGESSFEAALLKRAPGCEAWGYDYSVKSVRCFSVWLFLFVRHLTPFFWRSGDPRSTMIQSLESALTFKLGHLVASTSTRRMMIPSSGRWTPS